MAQHMSRLMERRDLPEAVIANDEYLAVHHFCEKNGLRVPADVAIGVAWGSYFSDYFTPRLTRVQIDHEAEVDLCTRGILRLASGAPGSPVRIEMEPVLIERFSTIGAQSNGS